MNEVVAIVAKIHQVFKLIIFPVLIKVMYCQHTPIPGFAEATYFFNAVPSQQLAI